MNIIFRKFIQKDKNEVISMMRNFYYSPAVSTNGSEEIFEKNFTECMKTSQFLQGYVICEDEKILGYSMISKSFSTEFAKECIWFEDLYLKKEYRNKHIIPQFIEYLKKLYPEYLFKLEVEEENTHAVYVYEKSGFEKLPYFVMKKY